jgi:phenylacetic acid degradation operon negative regulatory protein
MIDAILSSLPRAPTGDFVYSSLSFVARQRGGELPGTWFVDALGALGVGGQTVRQTLYRMEHSGILLTRRVGRLKWYRPSPTTTAIMDAGVSRVSTPTNAEWDGRWTLIYFRVGEEEREKRDRIRDVLLVEGFGALGPGLYVHPREQTERLVAAAREIGLKDRLHVFRGSRIAGVDDQRLVHETWDVASLASRYRKFIRRFQRVADEPPSRWSDLEAFGLRFAFMFEFFRIAWDDPSLPWALLPRDWPGEDARRLAEVLTRKLRAGAMRYADEILTRVAGRDMSSIARR